MKQLTDAITIAEAARRRNPSRYTSDGYLKPVCADGRHQSFDGALACEVCGVAAFATGSAARH